MIKIKLGIVDSDKLYLSRLTKLFELRYKNQIEIYSFSDFSNVPDAVRENKINVLLAAQDVQVQTGRLADYCMFAYLVESKQIDTYNKCRTICKYQRTDLIYKQLLGLYSEKLADKVRYKNSGLKKSDISLFVSGCDGAGATTAAAAYAEYLTARGRKTLFLNLKQFRDTGSIFSASGEGTFTDVIFAVKSRKVNMMLKLESIVKQSSSGVYFYDTCTNPLDYTEISADELKILIDEMSGSFGYEHIVIVSDFYFSDKLIQLIECASNIIIVSGDSKISQVQLIQKAKAISSLEKRKQINISDKLSLIFNRTKFTKTFTTEIPVLGIQPEMELSDERDIVRSFSASDMFEKICAREKVK